MQRIFRFLKDQDAATAVEYAVMLTLILMAVFSAVGAVGVENAALWTDIESDLSAAGVGS